MQHDIISRQRNKTNPPTPPGLTPYRPYPREENAGDQAKFERKTPQKTQHRCVLLLTGSYADYDADPVGMHGGQPDNAKPQGVYRRRPGSGIKSSKGG